VGRQRSGSVVGLAWLNAISAILPIVNRGPRCAWRPPPRCRGPNGTYLRNEESNILEMLPRNWAMGCDKRLVAGGSRRSRLAFKREEHKTRIPYHRMSTAAKNDPPLWAENQAALVRIVEVKTPRPQALRWRRRIAANRVRSGERGQRRYAGWRGLASLIVQIGG